MGGSEAIAWTLAGVSTLAAAGLRTGAESCGTLCTSLAQEVGTQAGDWTVDAAWAHAAYWLCNFSCNQTLMSDW